MYKAIFFDLDGTLLPQDSAVFLEGYFKLILSELAKLGDDPRAVYSAFMQGVEAMCENNLEGRTNKVAFWEEFERCMGKDVSDYVRVSDRFYKDGFEKARQFTQTNAYAKDAVTLARRGGRRVVLATNPVFPRDAQLARCAWIGLCESDFDLVTDYETCCFTKPNSEYYLSICRRFGVKPSECLMIGNDVRDDMLGAMSAGIDAYLVTDCLIGCKDITWHGEQGSFEELLEKLEKL